MKHLRYRHEMMVPLVAAFGRVVGAAGGRRGAPARGRGLPGRRGRRLISGQGLGVSLAIQVVLVWLIGELITVVVDVMELWALLAKKHLEITLS